MEVLLDLNILINFLNNNIYFQALEYQIVKNDFIAELAHLDWDDYCFSCFINNVNF